MSDFDVTDQYELDWTDDVTASLRLRSGTTITVELGALADLRVASKFSVFMPDGELMNDHLEIQDNDEAARLHMAYLTRTVINAEEPLGFPINWDNQELIELLVEQDRIILCPACLGSDEENCMVCLGTSYVRMEEFVTHFDVEDNPIDLEERSRDDSL